MWPHKKGLGVRLSYGVDGSSIVGVQPEKNPRSSDDDSMNHSDSMDSGDPESAMAPIIESCKIQEEGSVLFEIANANTHLVRSSTSSFNLNSRMFDSLEIAVNPMTRNQHEIRNAYVPDNILNSYMIESKTLTSTIAYDPNYSNLFAFVDVRTRKGKSFKAATYVTGESGNILNISIVGYQRLDVTSRSDGSTETKLLFPEFSKPFQISLSEPIKQLEVATGLYDYTPSYIIVRTNYKIYLLDCYKSSNEVNLTMKADIEMRVLGEIEANEMANNEFADVTFNPFDFSQFGVVDTVGNFGLWSISSTSKSGAVRRVTLENSGATPSAEDSTELSNWKRFEWAHDRNHILILTRTSVTEFCISPKLDSRKLITSNTWSRVQDFVRFDDFAFLLTSKELIWFSNSDPLKRLISWKHFLDDTDSSLKLQVTRRADDTFICVLYSQLYPLIFIYSFGLRGSKPYSIRDPYYFRKEETSRDLRQITLVELTTSFFFSENDEDDFVDESDLGYTVGRTFGLFEITADLSISLRCLSDLSDLSLTSSDKETLDLSKNTQDMLPARPFGRQFKYIPKKLLQSLSASLVASIKELPDESEQIKSIQDYAYALGEGALKIKEEMGDRNSFPSYHTLLDIAKNVPLFIEDVSEFDLMIEQLSSFYISKGICMSSLIDWLVKRSNILGVKDSDGAKTHANDIFELFYRTYFSGSHRLKSYNSIHGLIKFTILLSASLIKSKSDDLSKHYEHLYNQELLEASSKISNLLESWDTDYTAKVSYLGSQATQIDYVSSMPSLGASQKKTASKSKQSLRKTAITQSQTHSQLRSSQAAFGSLQTNLASDDISSSQEGSVSSSQIKPSQSLSQKRSLSSQQTGSQKSKKKKKKGGFA
ncbi:RNA polymerase I transcription factor [Scheffersomyces xylosifermentans]|uniref:RNA polymerase I transcription factor n=1 Tax=Scheffersomyces xylosifermentans TaxID=1304137 RepID=UPI00315D2E8F